MRERGAVLRPRVASFPHVLAMVGVGLALGILVAEIGPLCQAMGCRLAAAAGGLTLSFSPQGAIP